MGNEGLKGLVGTTRNRSKLLPVCLVCGLTPRSGIRGGMVIHGRFLCNYCEKEIVTLEGGNNRYREVSHLLKRLWPSRQ